MSENTEENSVKKQRIRVNFKDIPSSAWEHPADKLGMKAIKTMPGLEPVMRMFLNFFANEQAFRLFALASSVRVNEKQFPRIHRLHLEACTVLHVEKIPELFVSQNPFFNAGAIGIDDPLIILNSSLLDAMTDDEILFVIGHELGHIKSEHMLYRTLFFFLELMMKNAHRLPLAGIAIGTMVGIYYALMEWSRKSELSCDRAGLLTVQDPEVAIQIQMKFTGGTRLEEMDLGEFMKQAEEYNEKGSLSDNMLKIFNLVDQSHPFPVIRVHEMMTWVQSGEYENILRGYFSTTDETPISDDVKKAKESYKRGFKQTIKPLEDMMKDMKETVEKGAKDGKTPFDFFDKWRKKQ
ncbi:MAG: Zn-dependent protease with chaperone function [Flammeovirgaceae bacterium]|jgi:Zn-dependent protease with chaperone function